MGGNQTQQEQQPGLQDHERLGPVCVKQIDDPHGQDKISTMQFTRSVQSQKLMNDWVQNLQRIDDSETRQTILIPDKHLFQKAGLCGSSGTVKLIYENFPFVLESEILNRSSLQREFLETQMWYLLYSMVRAGTKFEKIKQKIGDVHPYNVLINDDGQIKLISKCSIPGEITNFDRIVEDKQAKVFLAPQELVIDAIQKGQYPTDIDQCKAEVFSIGLTILASGILDPCRQVYHGCDQINETKLNENLHHFRSKYSPYMFEILCSMLTIRPSDRRSCSSIFNQLRPHEEQILDLEPFEPRVNTRVGNTAVRQSNYLNQGYNLVQQGRQTQPVQYQQVPYQQQQQQQQYKPQNSSYGHPYLK